MVFWVNLHNSFPVGLSLVGIFLVSDIGNKLLKNYKLKPALFSGRTGYIFCILGAIILATFINPYGSRIWLSVFDNVGKSLFRSREWLPTAVNSSIGRSFFISLFAGYGILLFSRKKLKIEEIILLIFFGYQGLRHLRMVLWWGLVSAPVFASHFQSIVNTLKTNHPLYFLNTGESKKIYLRYINALIIIMLLGISVIVFPYARKHRAESEFLIDSERYPVAIAEHIKTYNLSGNIYNYSDWGSYLIWKLWPQNRTFLDARLHIVPDDVWEDYWIVREGKAGWEEVLKNYDISILLLNKKKNKYILEVIKNSKDWEVILTDDAGVLLGRI